MKGLKRFLKIAQSHDDDDYISLTDMALCKLLECIIFDIRSLIMAKSPQLGMRLNKHLQELYHWLKMFHII